MISQNVLLANESLVFCIAYGHKATRDSSLNDHLHACCFVRMPLHIDTVIDKRTIKIIRPNLSKTRNRRFQVCVNTEISSQNSIKKCTAASLAG